MKTITITIAPDGALSTRVDGVKGAGCRALTKPILDALGGDVLQDQPTAEAFEQADEREHVRAGGGSGNGFGGGR